MSVKQSRLPSRTGRGGTAAAWFHVQGGFVLGTENADADLVDAVIASELTVKDLWCRYHQLGGERTRQELQDYLSGEAEWTDADHAMLADALHQGEEDGAA